MKHFRNQTINQIAIFEGITRPFFNSGIMRGLPSKIQAARYTPLRLGIRPVQVALKKALVDHYVIDKADPISDVRNILLQDYVIDSRGISDAEIKFAFLPDVVPAQ